MGATTRFTFTRVGCTPLIGPVSVCIVALIISIQIQIKFQFLRLLSGIGFRCGLILRIQKIFQVRKIKIVIHSSLGFCRPISILPVRGGKLRAAERVDYDNGRQRITLEALLEDLAALSNEEPDPGS